jgi:hypothetical protein
VTATVDIGRLAEIAARHSGGAFLGDPSTRAALTLWTDRSGRGGKLLECIWAPFDHVEEGARIAIVGITPGVTQAENALAALRASLRGGRDLQAAMRDAKIAGSFSGDLRENLCRLLDHVGLPRWLGVPDTRALFDPSARIVHFTSALRHPVFREGKNYNGTPRIKTTPTLRDVVERHLAVEIRALPDAYWLPLWDTPASALHHLAQRGILNVNRILPALPHPAGENGENISYFLGTKMGPLSRVRASTGPVVLERREGLTSFFAA